MMERVETLQGLLSAAAEKFGDALAVEIRGRKESYTSLLSLATRLSDTLRQRGVLPGDRVAVCLNKSVEAMASMYAVHLCGAVFVPLDPIAPPGRIIQLILDADPAGLMVERRNLEIIQGADPDWGPPSVVLHPSENVNPGSLPSLATGAAISSPDSSAYQLYTSGTSGLPKGVVHTHASALAFARWASTEFALSPDDRVANHAGFHFDLSTFDYLSACLGGAAVCPVPENMSFHGDHLVSFICDQRISVWYSVPLALRRMLESTSVEALRDSNLRCVLFAGEVFPTAELHALRQLLPNVRLVNLYGPTETNVCLWREVSADDLSEPFQPIPIGKPCPGITLWFDGDTPEEEKGELCVSGPSVMKGYWRAQEHSDLAFVSRESDSGEQMRGYLTGDLVSRDADGVYRFLGRLDRQVKIRGFRVELGEVEATLRDHPAVLRGVAVAPSDQKGIHRIEAFIRVDGDVADEEREITVRSISKYCVDRLPMHMVPTRIHVLDVFPATPNGKIDRRALTRRCERVDPS